MMLTSVFITFLGHVSWLVSIFSLKCADQKSHCFVLLPCYVSDAFWVIVVKAPNQNCQNIQMSIIFSIVSQQFLHNRYKIKFSLCDSHVDKLSLNSFLVMSNASSFN